ncbi:DUF4145 domain-containing protein [Azospirillum doebereinerae]|uniref:DUF4145 domain-containing protein n=1 Tax=Azospirillum doebereinerae TaxID=92933 RepID=UPI001EE50D27|nr:DUF4145 domain-containing protein [Azospirillum doebereinerae]MCG5244150.1 DUF4145 domain-containing protein [Azospirillum doebereinerae]
MAVNRTLWTTIFEKDAFPGLPCPQCRPGKLKLVKGSLSVDEPPFSAAYKDHPDWEPDWPVNRFTARLQCDEVSCGEIVMMTGDTEIVDVLIEEEVYSGWGTQRVLHVRTIFPAPPLFHIPKSTPGTIESQLNLCFQLFWTDLPSCVARLRTSVELMLDDQKIARERLNKQKTKMTLLTLHDRIDLFASQAIGADTQDSLHALRSIGNLGTHGTSVNNDAFFDALDVFEDVLLGIYEKNSIKMKAKKLRDTKGDYDNT